MTPMGVRCCRRSWPEPLQLGQVLTDEPFFAPLPPQSPQVLVSCTDTCFLQPLAASSNEIITEAATSPPRRGALGLARRPPPAPPKKEEKISPKSKSIPSNPAPP